MYCVHYCADTNLKPYLLLLGRCHRGHISPPRSHSCTWGRPLVWSSRSTLAAPNGAYRGRCADAFEFPCHMNIRTTPSIRSLCSSTELRLFYHWLFWSVRFLKKVFPRLRELAPQPEAGSRNLGKAFLRLSVKVYQSCIFLSFQHCV